MRTQATTKLLIRGMAIGLVLAAGAICSGAQSTPAQLNDVHKQLIQSTQGAPVTSPAPAQPKSPSTPAKAPAAQSAAKPADGNATRRDPFDPLVGKEKEAAGPQVPLPAGKPGLVIGTLLIDGIVRGPNGMIAIVSNPQMRVYFLREGDNLYDGDVEHITLEGVSFHQIGKDAFGKPVEREVSKRLFPISGEQQ